MDRPGPYLSKRWTKMSPQSLRVIVILLLLLCCFYSTCCAPVSDIANPPTLTATATLLPTATNTLTITSTPWPTRTPTPSPTPLPTGTPTSTPSMYQEARVTRVIDGDTIYVEIDGREYSVRYIGVDALEDGSPCAVASTEANRRLVEGRIVRLEKDISETDKYARLLRYVYVGDTMVNAELVRQGYAQAISYPPDIHYSDFFSSLEQEARAAGRGCWSQPEPTATLAPEGKVVVDPGCCQFDAPGNDHDNRNEEYVCFTNRGTEPVDMSGWQVSDEKSHTYRFPAGVVLGPGACVRLRTGSGSNSVTDLYWNSSRAIWNNGGDTVYLYDAQGREVTRYSY